MGPLNVYATEESSSIRLRSDIRSVRLYSSVTFLIVTSVTLSTGLGPLLFARLTFAGITTPSKCSTLHLKNAANFSAVANVGFRSPVNIRVTSARSMPVPL